MNFKESPEFSKELKKFTKKYKSLPEDINQFKKIVLSIPLGNSKHFNIITKTENCVILKARLFCRYLKGNSLRIVYSYNQKSSLIKFIEVYFKGEKENEDKERIKQYLKTQKHTPSSN
jgi:mRNA-degrading endonuclease RelE of RelBE toxin-antitoxin system